MMKYATAIRLGTASTEAILRRFSSDVTHPGYAAMLEVGRAQRTIFLARYMRDRDLQREINAGLNVVENYNGNDYIFFRKSGELSSNRREEQEISMICLQILQSCLGYINTLMIEDTLAGPEWAGKLGDADRRGLTPPVHREHDALRRDPAQPRPPPEPGCHPRSRRRCACTASLRLSVRGSLNGTARW
jgi:TnpA family transposase